MTFRTRLPASFNMWPEHGGTAETVAPALNAGQSVIPRADVYALFELLFAIRDSSNVDLRESCPRYFLSRPSRGFFPTTRPSSKTRKTTSDWGLKPCRRTRFCGRRRFPAWPIWRWPITTPTSNRAEQHAGLVGSRSFRDARRLRRAVRVPLGKPVSAGAELLSGASGLPRPRLRGRIPTLGLAGYGDVDRALS